MKQIGCYRSLFRLYSVLIIWHLLALRFDVVHRQIHGSHLRKPAQNATHQRVEHVQALVEEARFR
jgi:hypothetical protein